MIIGIDLGTSNSLATYWDGEKTNIIPTEFDEKLMPSVVGLDDDGELIVGDIAKERLLTHPHQTVSAFKRFMGSQKKYQLGKWTLTPVELSSLVLKKIKDNAAVYFDEPITEAIISVPAYFNNIQREATIEAAKLAGLTVKGIISEPTAAAIAYSLHKELDQIILVCDLGGGTYDVSLMELFDGIMQVEAISGDNELGGEDFTQLIYEDIIKQNQLNELELTSNVRVALFQMAEKIKKEIDLKEKIAIQIDVHQQVFSYELIYEEYERLCKPLLNRLKQPLLRVLKDGQIEVQDIDRIILVGGATKAKLVRQFIAKLFRKFPYSDLEADETVALGVGLQASMKTGEILKEEMMLTDVCAHTLGVSCMIETATGFVEGVYQPIIDRNSPIPISQEHIFSTVIDGQTEVFFEVYQGEYPRVVDNLKIGEASLKLPSVAKDFPIKCRFTYDVNGILEVMVSDISSENQVSVVIEENPGALSKKEIKEALNKLSHLKVHPKERENNRLLLAKLDRLYAEEKGVNRENIGRIRTDFQIVLDTQQELNIKKKQKEVQAYLLQHKQLEKNHLFD